jgi:hypothetical protein
VAFLAGVNRMTWRAFLVWNAAGGVVWAIIYGLLGFYLGRHVAVLERVIQVAGIGGVVLGVVVVAVLVGVWWLRRRRARLAAGAAGHGAAMPTAGPASPVVHGASAQAVTLAGTPAGLTLASGATNGASTNGASARAVPRVRHGDTTGTRRPFVVRRVVSGERDGVAGA